MKQHIFLMFTKQGTSFTQLQLRMLHLLRMVSVCSVL